MVDSADPGFYGAAGRLTDFCQQLYAGSVYLQFVLKSKTISLKLPEPLANWLARRVNKLGRSRSDLVCQALEEQWQGKNNVLGIFTSIPNPELLVLQRYVATAPVR